MEIDKGLYADIKSILEQARENAVRAVNFSMVIAYWEIGKRIVEEDQQGNDRANYGEHSLKELSKKLTIDFGNGFSVVSLTNFRKFYLMFSDMLKSSALRTKLNAATTSRLSRKLEAEKPSALRTIFDTSIPSALRTELSWTHYRLLMRVEDEAARNYYMNEAAEQNWSTRTLERQIHSLYFQRLLSSKNKQALITKTAKENRQDQPTILDFVKDPYISGLVMKISITVMFMIASILLNAQTPNYYSGSQVTASDGTIYKIKHLSPKGIRINNASNRLEAATSTLPNTVSMYARIESMMHAGLNNFNKIFSKDRLLAFSKERIRVYQVADRTKRVKEAYFFLGVNTTISPDDLRKIEKYILTTSLDINKWELKRHQTTGDRTWQPVSPPVDVDQIPEFNGIPYFTTIEYMDFREAYRAVPRIGKWGNTVWVNPGLKIEIFDWAEK